MLSSLTHRIKIQVANDNVAPEFCMSTKDSTVKRALNDSKVKMLQFKRELY